MAENNIQNDELTPDMADQAQPEEAQAIAGETVRTTADHSRVVELKTVEDVMEWSYLRYSMSVIVDRALPDVRDGMKPIHRRILYTMERNGWRPGTKFVKSARIVGDVMGKYHPHGDSAIYDAMVRLAQDWVMRYPLVEGQGNFGSMDGDPPAASRYTEARMARAGAALLADLDKDTVDFRDNYDGTLKEPVVLPAKLPNLLLNGQVGIAVGMATSIPTHNLGELCDAITYLIDHGPEETTIDDLMKFVKGPDFPTGGIVYAGPSMKQAYLTGRGSVVMRAVTNIEETSRGRSRIVISEVPYGTNKETLIQKIADLVKEKKIVGIQAIRDESARGKVHMVIDLKKDAYPNKVLNQLFKWTSLQSSFHYNMLALVDGIQPRVLGLEEILNEYLKHRRKVVRRRTEFELRKARDRAHILEGLKIALDNIDEVIHLIRSSRDYETAKTGLMSHFKLSEVQAQAILAMQLRKLTGLDRQAIEDELKELLAKIAEYEAILADEQKILNEYQTHMQPMEDKGNQLATMFSNINPQTDKATTDSIQKLMSLNFEERENATKEFIKKYPKSFTACHLAGNLLLYTYPELKEISEIIDTVTYAYSYDYRRFKENLVKTQSTWIQDMPAPDFVTHDLKGKEVRLSDFKGKYLLLDFWASWCRPCRQRAAELKAIYDQLQTRGITVCGLSMDKNKAQWEAATKEDGIIWTNTGELKPFKENTIAADYKVSQLPTMFLIDPDGKIIMQNPEIEDLMALPLKK